jgi:hypothetical protein
LRVLRDLESLLTWAVTEHVKLIETETETETEIETESELIEP